jgi:hypothetical protein
MKILMVLGALALGGCVVSQIESPQQLSDRLAAQRVTADTNRTRGQVRASPKESAARGSKTCTVKNMSRAMVIGLRHGGANIWTLHMVGEEYPLSTIYLRMEGKRYSAREDRGLALTPAMIEALKRDPELDIAWTNWPYGTSEEHKATLTGFSAAFDECDAFLKSPLGS